MSRHAHAHASFRSARVTLGAILAGLIAATFGGAAYASLLPPLPTLTGGGTLILRLDANAINGDGNPNPADGASVSTWTDLSGNGNNATQGTLARQPIYMANQTPNSSGAVQFNGSAFLLNPTTISGPTTWFMVYNTQSFAAASESPVSLPSINPATSAATYDQVVFLNFGGYQNITVVADGDAGATVGINPAFDSSSHLFAFTYNGAGKTTPANYQMAYDQTDTTVNASGGSSFAFAQSDGTIGQRGNNTAFYSGNLSAVLVYSGVLNTTDYNAVQSYLNHEFLVAPEPASLGLLAAGGLILLRRRRA